jgi:hypothetical protein
MAARSNFPVELDLAATDCTEGPQGAQDILPSQVGMCACPPGHRKVTASNKGSALLLGGGGTAFAYYAATVTHGQLQAV